jgi:hypothetical protein
MGPEAMADTRYKTWPGFNHLTDHFVIEKNTEKHNICALGLQNK